MQSLESMTATYEAAKKKMQDEVQAGLKAAFAEFFAANPAVGRIVWTQYTPYFMDGDTCTFGTNEFVCALKPEHYVDEEVRAEVISAYTGVYDLMELVESAETQDVDAAAVARAFDAFEKMIGKVPDEIFEGAFGDHVKVIATPDGFDVEEHDHD